MPSYQTRLLQASICCALMPEGQTWKQIMRRELDLDESRLHWPGLLPGGRWW